MRITAIDRCLGACFVAALVSLVSAAPADKETTERVSYKGKAGARTDAPPKGDGEWVELADPTPANHGKEYISVGSNAGTFTRLRLDASKGRPIIMAVRIDFKTGKSRVVHLQVVLDKKKRPSAYVDLGGPREIQQVVVTTDPVSKATYTVHAEVGHAGVASR
jgi:hypothetical protein